MAEQVLHFLQPLSSQAALQAIDNLQTVEDERLAQKRLALQRAAYEVSRAQRQYDAVDPANRLVAGSLERRWNDALAAQSRLEEEGCAKPQTSDNRRPSSAALCRRVGCPIPTAIRDSRPGP